MQKGEKTLSNAMDVGDPSNFIRIQKIVNNDLTLLKKILSGFSYSDAETKKAIEGLYKNYQYICKLKYYANVTSKLIIHDR